MSYEYFENKFPGFKGKLTLYIEGSQGVSPALDEITWGVEFTTEEEIVHYFFEFVDFNAVENIDSYLEDCDFDCDEAQMEAVMDSGRLLLGIDEQNLTHILYADGSIETI